MEVYCGQVLATFEINKYMRNKETIAVPMEIVKAKVKISPVASRPATVYM